MEKDKIKYIPFLETIGRSFKYVFKNKALIKGILPLVVVLVILQMSIGMPFLCSLKGTCHTGLARNLTILSLVLGAAGIIINYCRTIICRAEVDFYSLKFWKQMLFYLIASMLLGLIFFIVFAVSLILLVKTLGWLNLRDYVVWGIYIDAVVIFILLAPMLLAFPAIAAEDYKMLLPQRLYKTAWGNCNAIFWGQFIIMIPYWLSFWALKEIYAVLPNDLYIINLIFVICLAFISMVDAGFKGAFFAQIYQFFKK